MTAAAEKRATIARLRADLSTQSPLEADPFAAAAETGPLARLLGPAWRPGGTVELVGPEPAALTLAAWLAARRDGPAVVIDPAESVFPRALKALGLDPRRVATVRPPDKRLALWALEQALRCAAVAATLGRIGPTLATTAARRLKLAAEAGGGIGLIVRPAAREPPFGDARLKVRPVRSERKDTLCPRWEVEAVYVRGGREGQRCVVEVLPDARLVPVAPELVRAAGPGRRLGG
jgi:protein ImuA